MGDEQSLYQCYHAIGSIYIVATTELTYNICINYVSDETKLKNECKVHIQP